MAHLSDILDFTTNAFIVRDNKVLLVFNTDYNSWFGPGGHIEKDENVEESLFREIYEETGIEEKGLKIISSTKSELTGDIFSDMDGKMLSTPNYVDVHKVSTTHFHLAFRYFLTTNSDFTESKDVSVTKLKWFSIDELQDPKYNLRKHVISYSLKAIETAGLQV